MLEWLDSIFGVVGRSILAAIGSFFAGLLLQEVRIRKMARNLRKLSAERGQTEVAFVVSNRENIRPAVERYLKQKGKQKIMIFEHFRPEPFPHDPAEWHDFVNRVRSKVREMGRFAPTRILLFTNVPVAMGVFLGAILDNGPEVIVHHYFNGLYYPVGILTHESVGFDSPNLEVLETAAPEAAEELINPADGKISGEASS